MQLQRIQPGHVAATNLAGELVGLGLSGIGPVGLWRPRGVPRSSQGVREFSGIRITLEQAKSGVMLRLLDFRPY